MFRKIAMVLEMLKFQHTLFALPFALTAMLYAASPGLPAGGTFGWILAAMVTARTAAMAFNRLVDRKLDALNPRTQDRALVRGTLSPAFAACLTLAMAGLFVASAAMLNRLCLLLSPVALVVILGYSLTKRFTWLCHLALGLALAMAPAGAWIAVTGKLETPFPLLLSAAVLAWVAGFDVLYALLDLEFDRANGIHSIPARFGEAAARRAAALLHLAAAGGFLAAGLAGPCGGPWFAGVGLTAALLTAEHSLARTQEPGRLNQAFFHLNAVVGLTLLAAAGADAALR